MKAIKYIISFSIIFIGLLIVGESHIFYVNDFYTNFANTTLFKQPNTTDEEMKDDIIQAAENNQVDVFTFISSPRGSFSTDYVVYGTEGVEENFRQQLNIVEDTYESLFLGTVSFTFKNLTEIERMENLYQYYVIGDDEKVQSFKIDLIDTYAGNHPQFTDENNQSRNNMIFIWIIIISVILLLSYYDVILQKKESLIRITMGESIHWLYSKNIFLDIIVLLASFLVSLLFLAKFTAVYFQFPVTLIMFSLLLLLNTVVYSNLYFYKIKEVFSNTLHSKKLLTLNYSLKIMTTMLTVFIISSNLAFIAESVDLYKQKAFFQTYKDYSFTRLNYKPVPSDGSTSSDAIINSAKIQHQFYREYIDEFNAILLFDITSLTEVNGIFANKNSLDYLTQEIPELADYSFNDKIYFIIPSNWKNNQEIIDKLNLAVTFYEGNETNEEIEVIYYEKNTKLITIDENDLNGSKFVKKPAIIFNNKSLDGSRESDENVHKMNYFHNVMYKLDEEKFGEFIAANQLKNEIVSKTNVLENYYVKWNSAKRILYINSIFTILILLLEFIIIASIIKLEYEVNAIELALKKVLGYSKLEKYRLLIIMSTLSTLVSILATILIAVFNEMNGIPLLIFGGVMIFIMEWFLIVIFTNKKEKANVTKILKGGNL
ncbi:DUF1430 domain-containing protein [Bacillus kwashiorkori]|uniref:DUF1430 domain-containing protein n=1 Tax=Bacillus kwashiorkori TaxID=1522318 RepID=UPI0007864C2D|nr:DUF1430 domain-containing protein [Bacillus kwashiorkori]